MEKEASMVLQLGWAIYMSTIFIVVMIIATVSYMRQKKRGALSDSEK